MHEWGYAPTIEALSRDLIGGSVPVADLLQSVEATDEVVLEDGFAFANSSASTSSGLELNPIPSFDRIQDSRSNFFGANPSLARTISTMPSGPTRGSMLSSRSFGNSREAYSRCRSPVHSESWSDGSVNTSDSCVLLTGVLGRQLMRPIPLSIGSGDGTRARWNVFSFSSA